MILNYREILPHDNYDLQAEAKVLVLIHGLFGNSDNLTGPAKAAADAGFRVILPDLRNHGNSFRDDVSTLFDMAGDIIALADSLGLNDFHIAGHSLGGRVTMLTALLHSERIKSIAILDIAPVSYSETHHWVFQALKTIDPVISSAEARKKLGSELGDNELAGFLTKGYRSSSQGGHGFAFDIENLHANYPDLMKWPDVQAVCNAPGIGIYGGLSTYVTAEGEASLKRLFPGISLVKLENAGHMVHIDGGDQFRLAWIDYLKGRDT